MKYMLQNNASNTSLGKSEKDFKSSISRTSRKQRSIESKRIRKEHFEKLKNNCINKDIEESLVTNNENRNSRNSRKTNNKSRNDDNTELMSSKIHKKVDFSLNSDEGGRSPEFHNEGDVLNEIGQGIKDEDKAAFSTSVQD